MAQEQLEQIAQKFQKEIHKRPSQYIRLQIEINRKRNNLQTAASSLGQEHVREKITSLKNQLSALHRKGKEVQMLDYKGVFKTAAKGDSSETNRAIAGLINIRDELLGLGDRALMEEYVTTLNHLRYDTHWGPNLPLNKKLALDMAIASLAHEIPTTHLELKGLEDLNKLSYAHIERSLNQLEQISQKFQKEIQKQPDQYLHLQIELNRKRDSLHAAASTRKVILKKHLEYLKNLKPSLYEVKYDGELNRLVPVASTTKEKTQVVIEYMHKLIQEAENIGDYSLEKQFKDLLTHMEKQAKKPTTLPKMVKEPAHTIAIDESGEELPLFRPIVLKDRVKSIKNEDIPHYYSTSEEEYRNIISNIFFNQEQENYDQPRATGIKNPHEMAQTSAVAEHILQLTNSINAIQDVVNDFLNQDEGLYTLATDGRSENLFLTEYYNIVDYPEKNVLSYIQRLTQTTVRSNNLEQATRLYTLLTNLNGSWWVAQLSKEEKNSLTSSLEDLKPF